MTTRHDYVQAAPQWFRIGDFERCELSTVQFVVDRDLRQKSDAEFSKHHAFAGLNRLDFQNDVWQQSDPAKESVHQSPIAGAAVVSYQWFFFFKQKTAY